MQKYPALIAASSPAPTNAASSPQTSSRVQADDVSHAKLGSLQEAQANCLQPTGNDFPVRITSTPSDYLGPSIQIAVAILSAAASAMIIIWQMRRQKTLSEIQHRENIRAELRLDAYRDFQIVNRNFCDTNTVNVENLIRFIRSAFAGAIEQYKNIHFQAPLTQRAPAFMEAITKHSQDAIAFVLFLERYDSLLPRFEVYNLALNSALHDVRRTSIELFYVLLKWLPIDNPNFNKGVVGVSAFLQAPTITEEALGEFNAAAAPLEKSLGQLQCWTADLAMDLQNHLLGDYADKKVIKRNPIDNTFFTISIDTDKNAAQIKYFNEETEWGRNATRVNQEVTASMKTGQNI
jgi:hypothetical protein